MHNFIDLIIIEDSASDEDSLAIYLETNRSFNTVQCFRSVEGAIASLGRNPSDIAIIDLRLPGADGIEAARKIHWKKPELKIVILGTGEFNGRASLVLKAGAAAFLPRDIRKEELVYAIRAVHRGDTFLTPGMTWDSLTRDGTKGESTSEGPGLSEHQKKMLILAREGMGNKQIAASLGVTLPKVKHNFSTLLKALDARDRTHAVVMAIREGWIAIE